MVPDPHCASCNSTFVEMIENPDDDPRSFQVDGAHHDHGGPPGNGPSGPQDDGADQTHRMFQALMGGIGGPQRRTSIRIDRRSGNEVPDTTSDFTFGSGSSPRTHTSGFIWTSTGGGRRFGDSGSGGPDTLPPFASLLFGGPGGPFSPGARGANPQQEENGAPPAFLRHIIMSVLGGQGGSGQYGDYVFDNEALDQILTQLMEQSQGDKPVPAPDDMIGRLPRARVTPGSDLLQQDCAVCKDSFELQQETLSLPCNHTFHDECILPWLKQSGTCPVCRHELVPQPKHGGHGAGPNGNGGNGDSTGSGNDRNTGQTTSTTSNSERRHFIPGGWYS